MFKEDHVFPLKQNSKTWTPIFRRPQPAGRHHFGFLARSITPSMYLCQRIGLTSELKTTEAIAK